MAEKRMIKVRRVNTKINKDGVIKNEQHKV